MDMIPAIASQVTREQVVSLYQQRDISALKGAMEAQVMVQAELTAMMRELVPYMAQNIDISA